MTWSRFSSRGFHSELYEQLRERGVGIFCPFGHGARMEFKELLDFGKRRVIQSEGDCLDIFH